MNSPDFPDPFTFELLFEDDSLTGFSAHIVLRFCSKDEAGTTFLTPECKTPEELHYQFDRLKGELDALRTRAIRKLVENINGRKRKKRRS